jgi:glycolate oxidase iron-sulfur subunit
MDVTLAGEFRDTDFGREAEALMRACVQCGQCVPFCPTFRVLRNDWDTPRGRISLIRQFFEGEKPAADVKLHLDRCLTCRICEAVCPEHVRYGRLLDLAREQLEKVAPRSFRERLTRRALRAVVPHRRRFAALLHAARAARPLLPERLGARLAPPRPAGVWPDRAHARTMLVWQGCVQPALAPDINAAAARVLDRFGLSLVPAKAGCCGALSQHMAAPEEALDFMRRNLDACWPQIEAGAEAIVMTASGCGAHTRDYGKLLRDDPRYIGKARRFSELAKDLGEIVAAEYRREEIASRFTTPAARAPTRVAFQSPCSLQHGQPLKGVVEGVLKRAGFRLTSVAYPFLCCGAAGSYWLLQPELSDALRAAKLETLLSTRPDVIATANIGCLTHLAAASPVPVRHWIELLDEALPTA